MTPAEQWAADGAEVGRQSDLFRAALPGLLAGPLVGRWIVWSDGVVSDHADEHGALLDAHARGLLGRRCAVHCVEPERVVWLTDALRLVAPAEDR